MFDSEKIKVRIADIAVGSGRDILTTYGLGSCVAVMIYDPEAKIGGMNHFLLPTKSTVRNEKNLAKFSDTGIEELIRKLIMTGAVVERLVAKVVGGSNMFPTLSKNSIGQKNIIAVETILKKHSIEIISRDVGGTWGRSVEFYVGNGKVIIKSYKKGVKEI